MHTTWNNEPVNDIIVTEEKMRKFKAEELSDFARYYGFHYDRINLHAMVKELMIEMERGLAGKSSSLPMIPSYITPVTQIAPGKTVLALDAGGTNLRTSLVHFNENSEAVAQGTRKTSMPGANGRVSADQFYDKIADAVFPLLNETKVEGIGFTFSYHTEITPEAEGIPLALGKEIDAPEIFGKPIGASLRSALARRGCIYDGPIVMLNDTTATLLSGFISISPDGEAVPQQPVSGVKSANDYGAVPGPVIGFILGTGINAAYPETKIPKIGFDSSGSPQIIVCETGSFTIHNRGQLDMEYDSTTINPGVCFLEKATSGAYLGPLALHILKQAIRDEVVQFRRSDELLAMKHLETRIINEFITAPLAIKGPLGSLFGKDEGDAAAAVQYIISIITERAALISAATLVAIIEHMSPGYEPYSPVRIAVEGSTYILYKGMRRSLEAWLHIMLTENKPRPYVILPVEQASLFGAAVAALTKE